MAILLRGDIMLQFRDNGYTKEDIVLLTELMANAADAAYAEHRNMKVCGDLCSLADYLAKLPVARCKKHRRK